MAAVLLRVSRRDPFDLDAEAQPPDRELTQPVLENAHSERSA
jgi:hypothetical protein